MSERETIPAPASIEEAALVLVQRRELDLSGARRLVEEHRAKERDREEVARAGR